MRPNTGWQRGLQFFNGHLYVPDGTVGGRGLGSAWTSDANVVVTTATPGTAMDTQFKRTIYSNDGTHSNMEIGPRLSAAMDYQYWPGNARFLGGFYLSAIVRLESWNNNAGRLFFGFTGSNSAMCTSNTIQNNTIGLWHSDAMAQDELWLAVKDNGGTDHSVQITKHTGSGATAQVAVDGVLTTGITLLWEMWHFPNGLSAVNVNYKLSYFDTNTLAGGALGLPGTGGTAPDGKPLNRVKMIAFQEQGGLSNTKFMAPQIQISNGTDTVAGHFSMGVANIYVAPWSGEAE